MRLVIRGGTVIDGSGEPAQRADVSISDGRVCEVGLGLSGGTIIDASDLVVAPGFVDLHTHYDAQVHWDPTFSPSPHHGVTTVVAGNCGFTLAPMQQEHEDYVARMLARVEGIAFDAIKAGVPFGWNSFGDFLDRLEGRVAINCGFLVGHSTLRRLVMGDRAHDPASPTSRTKMAQLLAASLEEGAFGLSSTWSTAHSDAFGDPVPSRAADLNELTELASVVGHHPGTLLEFTPSIESWEQKHIDLMTDMSRAADRHLNWNVLRVERASDPQDHHPYETPLRIAAEAGERGAAIVALAATEPTIPRVCIATGVIFDTLPGWADIIGLPIPQRIAALASPERRRSLEQALQGRSLNWVHSAITDWASLKVVVAFEDANQRFVGQTVGDLAREQGINPFDAFLDIAVADQLRTYFEAPAIGNGDDAWMIRGRLWHDPRTVVGGSDAGAHLDAMCGATLPTSLLSIGVRERQLITLEQAIHQLSDVPARLYGLRGRGRIAPGYAADIVVLDPNRISPGTYELRRDLPGDASRLYCEPDGVHHVIVNGTEILRNNRATGNLPGTILRAYRDADTVTASDLAPRLAERQRYSPVDGLTQVQKA